MKGMNSCVLVVILALISIEIASVRGADNEVESGNGRNDNNNGAGRGNRNEYRVLQPRAGTGQERCQCVSRGFCSNKTLECPPECPERRPRDRSAKGCFVDCSSKCEASCRSRRPSCEGYGSVCYDPRFVGGDGRMFYFHGSKGSDFAIFSDDNLQVNAHFIGTRPEGRTRDFTWVQALAVIFDTHTLVVAANRVSHWDDNVDSLIIKWDGERIDVPMDGDAEWRAGTKEGREVTVERTAQVNNVKVTVNGLLEVNVKVTPISEKDNRVHNYQLPSDDAFAHLETEFSYVKLTGSAEGVLGQTYQPDYVSPVKSGVAMPLMGGEDKYRTPSLLSPICNSCKFKGIQYAITSVEAIQ